VIAVDGKTLFNALKQNPGQATWSNFKRLKGHLEWVDGLGDAGNWLEGVAPAKVADFAGEAEAQDSATLKDYAEDKRVALIACLPGLGGRRRPVAGARPDRGRLRRGGLKRPPAAGIMRGHGRDELTQDEVNDLPGDERNARWDADEEYERIR
jgi:hypothetical protein